MSVTTLLAALSILILGQNPPAESTPPAQEPYSLLQAQPSPEMRLTKDIKYAHRRLTRNALTSLDIYEPGTVSNSPRPILLFIHGGGWAIGDKSRIQHKPKWATDQGWVFVSINYRLSPRVQHPDHAIDTAAAIAYVIEHANEYNADPSKLVIMGHSAGAHLAAIVATDESLLAEHNLAPSNLSGVVLLDGAGYDIPAQMNSPLLIGTVRKMYEAAFGDDPKLWAAASPTLQANQGDTLPPLLAIHVGDRQRSRTESTKLVEAWQATSAKALIHHAPDKDHAAINKDLGKKNDPDTQVVSKFIYSVLGLD